MRYIKRSSGSSPTFRLKSTKNTEKPIILDFSYGRKNRFKYAKGYSIHSDYWNNSIKTVKSVKAVPNASKINRLILKLKICLEDFVLDFDAKQIQLTNALMKNHLDEFRDIKQIIEIEEEEQITKLIPYIKKYINRKEKELFKGPNGRKNNTIKSYEQTLNHLQDFEKEFGYELGFDLDGEFYADFVDFMKSKTFKHKKKQKHYSLNTIGKQIKSFRIFMGADLADELHSNLKYKRFKVLVELTTAIYLEISEMKRMLDLDFRKTPYLELAKDIFILGCEIGQRISDYHDLRRHEIVKYNGGEFIRIKQEKTGKEVLCKVTPAIKRIMNTRYSGKLPTKISKQKLNDYIKIIGQMAEINDQVKIERSVGGEKEIKYVPKY